MTCSGGENSGSLCVVRSGISFSTVALVDLHGIKDVWSIQYNDNQQEFFIVAFEASTIFLRLNEDGELATFDVNLVSNKRTILAAKLAPEIAIQVLFMFNFRLLNKILCCLI